MGLQVKGTFDPEGEEQKVRQVAQNLEKARKDLDVVVSDNHALHKSLEESHHTYTSLRKQLDQHRELQRNENTSTQVLPSYSISFVTQICLQDKD